MDEIQNLIPHRRPFLYLDELVSVSKEQIVGSKIFSNSDEFLTGSFPSTGFVPGVVLIESMAQCGGAGIKKLGLADGIFGLAHIECANFHRGVSYGKVFRISIKNLKVTERYLKQSGLGTIDNELCVDLTWTCVKIQ